MSGRQDQEEWREVPGTNGLYEVSNLGRVRSWHKRGMAAVDERAAKPHLMTHARAGSHSARSYQRVSLIVEGRHTSPPVHRLVLLAFVGPPSSPDMQGAHLNGNANDNRLENLAWTTALENIRMKTEHGTQTRGVQAPCAKLTDEMVAHVRRLRKFGPWPGYSALAKSLGVSTGTLERAILGHTWGHVEEAPFTGNQYWRPPAEQASPRPTTRGQLPIPWPKREP